MSHPHQQVILIQSFFSLKKSISKKDFQFIGNKNLVKKLKPNPDIYLLALKKLNLDAKDCIAIEDTQESLNSALKAQLKCIIFPGKFHTSKKFFGSFKKLNKIKIDIINK